MRLPAIAGKMSDKKVHVDCIFVAAFAGAENLSNVFLVEHIARQRILYRYTRTIDMYFELHDLLLQVNIMNRNYAVLNC